MRQKLLGIIFILLLMTALPFSAVQAAAETTLSFSPSSVSKTVGDTFTVNIDINTGTNKVQALDLVFTFDKSKVEVTGIATGALTSDFNEITKTIDNTNGKVTYSLGAKPGATTVVSGTGTIAVVSMKALAAGTSTQAWNTSAIIIAAQNESASVFKSGSSGTVTISAGSGGTTTTPTPTEPPTGGDYVTGVDGEEIPITGVDDWKHLITVGLGFIGLGAFLLFL